jgi:methionyl-tRNA formyltransferase
MRILFAGTPALAVPSLRAASRGCEIVGVLCAPDQPVGRGREPASPPVALAARELGLPLFQPSKLDAAFIETARSLRADLLAAVAYGKIFREPFLSLFPSGALNLHPSLLPRWRGPSPIPAVLLAGDSETGVTIQRMALKFDTGDILAQSRHPLTGAETAATLSDELAAEGAALLESVLAGFAAGSPPAGRAQDEAAATYCGTLAKADGRLDWTETAEVIERKVRAYDPWPRASTLLGGETLLLLQSRVAPSSLAASGMQGGVPGEIVAADRERGLLVRTGEGLLSVERLQLQFKKSQDWRSFVNGRPGLVGTRLGA